MSVDEGVFVLVVEEVFVLVVEGVVVPVADGVVVSDCPIGTQRYETPTAARLLAPDVVEQSMLGINGYDPLDLTPP